MKKILAVLMMAFFLGVGVTAASTTPRTTQEESDNTSITTQTTDIRTSDTVTSVQTLTPVTVETQTYCIQYTGTNQITLVYLTTTSAETKETNTTFNTLKTKEGTDNFDTLKSTEGTNTFNGTISTV
jgi:hypothetical protein